MEYQHIVRVMGDGECITQLVLRFLAFWRRTIELYDTSPKDLFGGDIN